MYFYNPVTEGAFNDYVKTAQGLTSENIRATYAAANKYIKEEKWDAAIREINKNIKEFEKMKTEVRKRPDNSAMNKIVFWSYTVMSKGLLGMHIENKRSLKRDNKKITINDVDKSMALNMIDHAIEIDKNTIEQIKAKKAEKK